MSDAEPEIESILINKDELAFNIEPFKTSRNFIFYHGKLKGEKVVVKKYKQQLYSIADINQKVIKEARKLSKIGDHPNICKFYGYYPIENDVTLLVFKCGSKKTLSNFLKRSTFQIPVRVIHGWLVSIADAVKHCHSKGVIIGDLKAANIIFDKYPKSQDELKQSVLKIIDINDRYETLTHMSPEAIYNKFTSKQYELKTIEAKMDGISKKYSWSELVRGVFKDSDPIDMSLSIKTDIWSYGVLGFEMITREIPLVEFEGKPDHLIISIAKGNTISLRDYLDEVRYGDFIKILTEMCWKYEGKERSTITDISASLKEIENIEILDYCIDTIIMDPEEIDEDQIVHDDNYDAVTFEADNSLVVVSSMTDDFNNTAQSEPPDFEVVQHNQIFQLNSFNSEPFNPQTTPLPTDDIIFGFFKSNNETNNQSQN